MMNSCEGKFDVLLDFLESIRQTCIDKSLPLTFDDENVQATYMCSLYSIVVELSGDSCQGVKARKELASHVLTRALLEAVVDLLNIIKNPKYVDIRFQKALIERRKKFVNILQNDPKLISGAGHKAEDVEDAIKKIDKLRVADIDQPNIKQRFKDAGMEEYYGTAYALLCDYAHHDSSAIINRHIGLYVRPLDNKGILMLSDLIADLLLSATIAVHDFLESDEIEALEDLISKWKTTYCQQAAV